MLSRSFLASVLLLSLAISGCDSVDQDSQLSGQLDALDGEPVEAAPFDAQLPPPPAATLTLTTQLMVLGKYNNVTVTGLGANQAVSVYRSVGSGSPVCLASPVICLDLRGPANRVVRAGTGTSNASGVATVRVWVPLSSSNFTNTYQAVGDPTNPTNYTVSNTSVGRYATATADADADGLTNERERVLGTNLENADSDGGGTSDGVEVNTRLTDPLNPADDGIDADSDGYYSTNDCDDTNAAINPGHAELCNGYDDDCDGDIDPIGSWWDEAYPYRITVPMTNDTAYFNSGSPHAIDMDFPALLASAGINGTVDPDSIRVVFQSCAASQPELPSEWLDGFANIFDNVDIVDTPNDGVGSVVFLHDRDGNNATRELHQPAVLDTFAIYFGTTTVGGPFTPPSYSSSLSATAGGGTGTLTSGASTATFSTASGGMLTSLNVPGRPNVINLSASQGINFAQTGVAGGGWVSPASGTGSAISVLYSGPIFAALQSTGTASNSFGGYTYTYTWFQVATRPEIYAKVTYTLDRASTILQNPFWGAGVRPLFIDNTSKLAASNGEAGGGSVPGFEWAYGTYDTAASSYGLALAFKTSPLTRSRPLFDVTGAANAGRYVGLVAQDVAVYNAAAPTYSGTAGTNIINNAVLDIFPHAGLFGSISNEFQGSRVGVTVAPTGLQTP